MEAAAFALFYRYSDRKMKSIFARSYNSKELAKDRNCLRFQVLHNVLLFQKSLLLFFVLLLFVILAVLGLRCCAWAFYGCGERGLLFVVEHGL